jgi:DNA-binding transcriptional regulator PaaX
MPAIDSISPKNLQRPITAKTLVLDLMRASTPNTWPIKELVEVGLIFGISANAIRVNTARLLAKNAVKQDERGSYALNDNHCTPNDLLHSWREGDSRIKPWQGDWLQVSISPSVNGKVLKNIEHACLRFGFQMLWANLWLRPNNLVLDETQLRSQLVSLAGDYADESIVLSVCSSVSGAHGLPGLTSLWPVKAIEDSYKNHIEILQRSINSLGKKTSNELLRETFILGGEGIHLLSLDPLLPAEIINVALRQQLTQLVIDYDAMGKPFWIERFQNSIFNLSPTHLQPSIDQRLLA